MGIIWFIFKSSSDKQNVKKLTDKNITPEQSFNIVKNLTSQTIIYILKQLGNKQITCEDAKTMINNIIIGISNNPKLTPAEKEKLLLSHKGIQDTLNNFDCVKNKDIFETIISVIGIFFKIKEKKISCDDAKKELNVIISNIEKYQEFEVFYGEYLQEVLPEQPSFKVVISIIQNVLSAVDCTRYKAKFDNMVVTLNKEEAKLIKLLEIYL